MLFIHFSVTCIETGVNLHMSPPGFRDALETTALALSVTPPAARASAGSPTTCSAMSKLRVTIALLIGGIAATIGYRAYQRSLLSPFTIGTVRPGMRFRDADDDAQREMKHGYTCRPVGGGVQICQLVTDGPIGVLKHVVDPSGRVAIIQFLISDSSVKTRKLGSRQANEWRRVGPGYSRPFDSELELHSERWKSADSLWSAEMTWRRSAEAPGMMTVTDQRRLRRIAESSPAAFLRLVEDRLLDSHDLANAASLAPFANAAPEPRSAEASADAIADASADASSVASLPRCSGVSAPVAIARDTASNSMEPALWAVAQQVVARAYPGMHLDASGRRMSLTDASGTGEEIVLYPNASTSSNDLYAFAVTFPQRLKDAASHAGSFDAANQCRATSEILIAHVDPATHGVADLQRVGVDDESVLNVIGALDFVPTADPPRRLIVGYLASYGTATWYGQVRWNEMITADSPRIMSRSPVSYGKKLPDASFSGGPLVSDNASPDDPYGLSYAPGTPLQFSTLGLGPRAPARHITLSTENGALPNGWSLLSQL